MNTPDVTWHALLRRVPGLALAGVLALGAIAAAGPASGASAPGLPPPLTALFGGPFNLTDHNGAARSDKDFRGRFMLIYFGYTYCPSICPANLQHMAGAMDALAGQAARVVPIFISVDPGRDTPEVLKEYVANFGDSFIGLTGTGAQVAKAARAFRIHARKVMPAGETDTSAYLVDHSSITYLMGPDGKFVTLFPHNTPGKVMAERIKKYLAQTPEGGS